ncbi:hypothetical protein Taro_046931 [Colocasia esculenta]|uniref:Uncharacterized protein n=1 Tax=Colocasia esculenta TaxID=4460 RepID=A0A843X6P2_COLES|nr:hypothetical protein [Colocasia esculenta]
MFNLDVFAVCNVPGAVCQDPRFIGADGITFYFHGRKDREFCLLSDSNLHINAHFIGRRAPNMTRDFTWVQSVGILFGSHRIYIGAQKTATWDDNVDRLTVIFDGETLTLPPEEGATWPMDPASAVSVSRTADANAITLEVEGSFKISAKVVPITDEDSRVHGYAVAADDCLAHLELGFKFYSLTAEVHGVLGQTYREDYVSRVKMSSNMPIMGGEPKYLSSGIYSIDCSVARFGRENPAAAIFAATEQASLSCDSGMGGGRGIVCKK